MIMKKAQGLSINVIVIAAIALLVLIVLVVILTGQTQKFGQGLGEAQKECKPSDIVGAEQVPIDGSCPSGKKPIYTIKADPGKLCCVPE